MFYRYYRFLGFITALFCSKLTPPLNGNLSAISAKTQEEVVAQCDKGYWFSDRSLQKTLSCDMKGSTAVWSGTVEDCQGKQQFQVIWGFFF